MPHRRHRVRVHVHNRYARCAKRCKKSRCVQPCPSPCDKDPCQRCVQLEPVKCGQLKCDPCKRYHSAEEVCRGCCPARKPCGGCGGGGCKKCGGTGKCGKNGGGGRCGGRQASNNGGGILATMYNAVTGDDDCDGGCGGKCEGGCRKRGGGCGGRGRTNTGGGGGVYEIFADDEPERPPTPCERFKSAEETCGRCRTSRQEPEYAVYTALVQQEEPCARAGPPPPCDDPAAITEEIVFTREHRWHVPSPGSPARPDPSSPCGGGGGSPRPCARPSEPARSGCRSPCSADGGRPGSDAGGSARRSASRRGDSDSALSDLSERSSRRSAAQDVPARRTQSEMLAGRQIVQRIANQVVMDDGTGRDQIIYHVQAEYAAAAVTEGEQIASSGSFSEQSQTHVSGVALELSASCGRLGAGRRSPDPEQTAAWRSTESESESESESERRPPPATPRPAERSAPATGPPSPLPRRRITSDPTLPATPAPPGRTTRSVDCQPPPPPGGRPKRLRTRGALTRLRERSQTRLNAVRQVLLDQQVIQRVSRQTVAKGPAGPADDIDVFTAQNLPAAEPSYQNVGGSRGDGAEHLYQNVGGEPVYQNVGPAADGFTTLYEKGGGGGGGGGGGAFQDTYDAYDGSGRAQYAASPSPGGTGRARFDDDGLEKTLNDQRYRPSRDPSPYLTRPADGTAGGAGGASWLGEGAGAPAASAGGGQGIGLRRMGGQGMVGRRIGVAAGIRDRLSRGFAAIRDSGAALYQRMSATRVSGPYGPSGRNGYSRQPGGCGGGRNRCSQDDGCCTDSDSDTGAINCSFMFYFNGDGGLSPFMSNMNCPCPKGTGTLSKKYCDMCDRC